MVQSSRRRVLASLPRIVAAGAVALGTLALAGTVHAQAFPSKPVRWVVPAAAGSAPDIIARLLSERVTGLWGQQVVVDNRPGAAGNIAAQAVARAPADGYTYLFGQASTLAINPYTFKATGFDADRELIGVINIGVSPFMLGVTPSVPAQTVAEFVKLAKADPGRFSFATSASRNLSHITGEMLKGSTGIDMVHVPYKGSAQAAQDTVAGQTQLYIDSIPAMAAHIQSGRLRVIGVSAPRRVAGYENIPTIAETIPGFEAVGWFAIVAPAGTPADIVARVNRDVNTVLAIPEIAARMRQFGMFDGGGSPADLDRFMKAERAKWGRVIREARIEPE
jgi:tripartite-type tricarboxylate transporter receptor subunit TctC